MSMSTFLRGVVLWAGLGWAAAGCEASTPEPTEFGIRVSFLTEDGISQDFPAEIHGGFMYVCVAREGGNCDDADAFSTWWGIGTPGSGDGLLSRDIDGDGRPEGVVDDDRVPADVPVRIILRAAASVGSPPLYSARVDGVVLTRGRRTFVPITLLPADQFSLLPGTGGTAEVMPLPESWTPRFGASVTPLSDGRILIAGGFDTASPAVGTGDCALVAPGSPAGSVCFTVGASRRAYLFVPGTGRLFEVASSGDGALALPRALHGAVALPGGHVFLAGGVDFAVLVFSPLSAGLWTVGLQPLPAAPPSILGYHTSFEVFDGELNALAGDPNRDGNFERGGVESTLGTLGAARLFSAFAAVPPLAGSTESRRAVALGGIGPAGAANPSDSTWEVFDLDAWPASTGTTLPASRLMPARPAPGVGLLSSASAGKQLWLVAGSAGSTDADLLTKWYTSATSPDGITEPGTTSVPTAARNFLMPLVTPLGVLTAPNTLLVAGSMGARCTFDGTAYTPSWTGDTSCPPDVLPPYSISLASGSLTVAQANNWTPGTDNPHLLGGIASLGDGSGLVVAGAATLGFEATAVAHRFRVESGLPSITKDLAFTRTYPAPALWPAGATTRGGDAVFVGGMKVTLSPVPSIELLDHIVVFNYEHPTNP